MASPNGDDITNSISAAQSSLPDIGLVILEIFTVMAFIYSLLVLKQVHQMIRVLPTPLSPYLKLLALGYTVSTLLVFVIIIIFLF